MAVFDRPSSHFPALGTLRYGRGYWEGSVDLPALGGSFPLILRATRDGPSEQQIAAMTGVVSAAMAIRQAAGSGMVEVHQESTLLPHDLGADANGIWRYLLPCQVEIADDSYYRDGRIAVLIIFTSTQHEDFAPAIETADGHFVGVLSGT